MASIIRIKRSSVSGNPATLAAGELAYSALADNGSNGGDRLYVGMGTETAGNAANHVVIGGKYFTDMVSAATNLNTASTIVKRDASGNISVGTITGTLSGNASTATTWQTARDLSLTGDGTATLSAVNGSTNVSAAFTLATVNTNTGSFGSATAIPVITVNGKGLITSVSTASISTTLSIAGGTGTDTVSLASDTLTFTGTAPINTAVTNNTVTISASDATTSSKGVASFSSSSFDVTSGAVTIKTGGVSNTQLANSSVTFGSTTVSLGSTSTSLAGLTELTVDNININGNEISSTNTNGDIVINPNGTGNVDVSGAKIVNLGTPTSNTDAVTKAYVDQAITGLDWKSSVNLLATSNVALTGSTNTLVIDGHSALDPTDNNVYRLLLIGQTNQTQNGIYLYTDNGTSYTLVRATDADSYDELISASVYVTEGTTYGQTGWVQTNHYLVNFGQAGNYQSWVQFAGSGAYVAGNGLALSGTTFSVNVASNGGIEIVDDSLQLKSTVAGAGLTISSGVLAVGGTADRITIGTDSVDIASTYVGQTSITTLGTITSGTWSATTIGTTKGGTGLTSYTTGDLLYASGTNTLAKLAAGTDGKVLQMSSGVPVWGDLDGGTY